MPRIKAKADVYAREDFSKELRKNMIDQGIESVKELADMVGLDGRTMYRRMEDIDKMKVSELAAIKTVLSPDPVLLLRVLGYTTKEIKEAVSPLFKENCYV